MPFLELFSDPAVWASFLTLTILEIVLGVDNVIFISIAAARLPEAQRRRARVLGLAGALVLRIGLLFSIAWIVSLSEPFTTILGHPLSWRDVILLVGGAFLIYKAATEIFAEVEGDSHHAATPPPRSPSSA
ncbi:TerC family protein [Limimaricola cinnabarinus]|uniref:TerC family protein n=1 Tax=Limimaricola cinnabarinus TaxID=1125964 RepID=UPI0004002ABB|nr:TerC family protein [Limimaricola cinnabarinus]